MNFRIIAGFESAEIETAAQYAFANVRRAGKDLEDEMGSTLVHLDVDGDTYWSAADLREFANFLNIVADAISDAEQGDYAEQENYNDDPALDEFYAGDEFHEDYR